MEILKYAGCFLAAYLIGCFNTAYLLGRLKNMDIRESGSKNPGASNAMVTMGWKAGVLVGAVDIFKCVLAVVIASLVFPADPSFRFMAATGCIVGHMFPFYLKFKGGKGFACLVGAILALDWRGFIVGGILIIAITLLTDYIALATLTVSVAYPVFAYFYDMSRLPEDAVHRPWLFALIAGAASLIIIIKHIPNIKKIANGTEIGLRGASAGKYRKK